MKQILVIVSRAEHAESQNVPGTRNVYFSCVGTPLAGRGFDVVVVSEKARKEMETVSSAELRTKMYVWWEDTVLCRLFPHGEVINRPEW
jgi:hypothetical protein